MIKPRYSVLATKYAQRLGNYIVRDLKDSCAVAIVDSESEALRIANEMNRAREFRLMRGRQDDWPRR